VSYDFSVLAQSLSVLVPRVYNGALFQTGAVALTVDAPAIDVEVEGDGSDGPHRVRVVAVGIDTITTANLDDGHVVTVTISDETLASDMLEQDQPLPAFLASLSAGAILLVHGTHDLEANTLAAVRIGHDRPDSSS
jgi:hypothetical protein